MTIRATASQTNEQAAFCDIADVMYDSGDFYVGRFLILMHAERAVFAVFEKRIEFHMPTSS
jgi:hypothetical protein